MEFVPLWEVKGQLNNLVQEWMEIAIYQKNLGTKVQTMDSSPEIGTCTCSILFLHDQPLLTHSSHTPHTLLTLLTHSSHPHTLLTPPHSSHKASSSSQTLLPNTNTTSTVCLYQSTSFHGNPRRPNVPRRTCSSCQGRPSVHLWTSKVSGQA